MGSGKSSIVLDTPAPSAIAANSKGVLGKLPRLSRHIVSRKNWSPVTENGLSPFSFSSSSAACQQVTQTLGSALKRRVHCVLQIYKYPQIDNQAKKKRHKINALPQSGTTYGDENGRIWSTITITPKPSFPPLAYSTPTPTFNVDANVSANFSKSLPSCERSIAGTIKDLGIFSKQP